MAPARKFGMIQGGDIIKLRVGVSGFPTLRECPSEKKNAQNTPWEIPELDPYMNLLRKRAFERIGSSSSSLTPTFGSHNFICLATKTQTVESLKETISKQFVRMYKQVPSISTIRDEMGYDIDDLFLVGQILADGDRISAICSEVSACEGGILHEPVALYKNREILTPMSEAESPPDTNLKTTQRPSQSLDTPKASIPPTSHSPVERTKAPPTKSKKDIANNKSKDSVSEKNRTSLPLSTNSSDDSKQAAEIDKSTKPDKLEIKSSDCELGKHIPTFSPNDSEIIDAKHDTSTTVSEKSSEEPVNLQSKVSITSPNPQRKTLIIKTITDLEKDSSGDGSSDETDDDTNIVVPIVTSRNASVEPVSINKRLRASSSSEDDEESVSSSGQKTSKRPSLTDLKAEIKTTVQQRPSHTRRRRRRRDNNKN